MPQLLLNLYQQRQQSTDNFIVSVNKLLFETLQTWLHTDSLIQLTTKNITSFYLSGTSGSGKTHLLKSSGYVYLDCQTINPQQFSELIISSNMLAIDHLSSLNTSQQIELFNCFNHIKNSGGKLLLADREPPLYLNLREDLRTRLGSGLIFHLQQLDENGMLQLIEQFCQNYQIKLDSTVKNFLLTRVPRDSQSLDKLFNKINILSLEKQRLITIPFVRELLAID